MEMTCRACIWCKAHNGAGMRCRKYGHVIFTERTECKSFDGGEEKDDECRSIRRIRTQAARED